MVNLRKGRSHRSQWRKDAREDYDFFAGKQWSTEDAEKLKNEKRPAVVFNRIVRTIHAVEGLEVQNRQKVTYIPRKVNPEVNNQQPPMQPGMQPPMMQGGQMMQPPMDQMPQGGDPSAMGGMPQQPMSPMSQQSPTNDTGYTDMLNDAADWVRDQCNAEDEESDAFEDVLICGEGWTETRMSFDDNVEGMIVKDKLDPVMMLVDPESKKRNYEDARWVAYVKDFPATEVSKMYPDIVNPQYGTFWTDSDFTLEVNADENFKYLDDKSDQLTRADMIAVVQYQYFRKEPVYLIAGQNGVQEFPENKFSPMKKQLDLLGIRYIKVKKKVYYQCFVVGNQIAEKVALGCNHFTLSSITGIRDKNCGTYFGLVRMMKDPQRWANKWLSQTQHILNTNSKGGVMIEDDAVPNFRAFEDKWALPDGVIRVNPGALSGNKIQAKAATAYPEGFDRLLQYAVTSINDVVGVNLEVLGQADRNQPMGLEILRKEAGITILAKFFDSLRRYRKMDGRILAYFIREYIADGRLIRILGPNGINYVPLIKDKVAFEYDVIVDEAPTSPHAKEKTFGLLSSMYPMLQQAGIPLPIEALDYAPLPDALIQAWKKTIKESGQPDPMQEQMKQITLLQAQLATLQQKSDIEESKSRVQKNMASAQKDASVAHEQEALAMQKFGVISGDQELKAQNMEADQNRKNMEMMLNQYRKLLEVQLDTKLRAMGMVKNVIPSLNQIQ